MHERTVFWRRCSVPLDETPLYPQASLAQKRALLQQQRKQRKQEADRMLARRQSGQMGISSKVWRQHSG